MPNKNRGEFQVYLCVRWQGGLEDLHSPLRMQMSREESG